MKNKTCTFLFFVFAIIYSSHSFGQVSSYYFIQSSGTYVPITGGTPVVSGSSWDDGIYTNLPIGFSFVFAGITYANFTLDINGNIRFGSFAGTFYCPTNLAASDSNIVCGYMTDLHGNSAGSEVRYQTIGTNPNLQLVVQWLHVRHYPGASGDDWNFQIVLSQTTNCVQLIWGLSTDVTTNGANNCADVNGESGACGLIGNGRYDANLRVVTNGSTTWATSTGADTVTTTNVCNMNSTNVPASGLIWSWCPSISGITAETDLNHSLNIFPNPFHDHLAVAEKGNAEWEVTLFDVTSRALLHQRFVNSVDINTESLAKGVYLYEVTNNADKSGGVMQRGKIVKF